MKVLSTLFGLALCTNVISGFGTLCGSSGEFDEEVLRAPTQTPQNYKVAFLGDAGNGSSQKSVLNMVKSWGAAAVIHSGDFDYADSPSSFDNNIQAVFGSSYPYFASIGNHDIDAWTGTSGYQARLIKRLQAFGGDKNCTGDYGVNMVCNWNGLLFILSGVGTRGSNHVNFIDSTFNSQAAIWKFVSWHKNQRLMQIGGKSDETGWSVYDTTRKHGAILVTAHEHSYCRSHLMSNFQSQTIASKNATLNLSPGNSFVFVSGLGGQSIRSWDDDLVDNPWWASVAADDNGVDDGALLCTFNVNGNPRKANCIFKDISGKTWDSFDIISNNPATKEEMQAALKAQGEEKCVEKWIEVPISRPCKSTQETENGGAECSGRVVELGRFSRNLLSFEDIPLKKGDKIKHAFLQVYGAGGEEGKMGDFVISAKNGQKKVLWEKDDEDWERHTVWVSADLKEILEEALEGEDWQQKLTLVLKGSVQKSFYSFDHSPCHAPTLAIELEADC